MNVKFVVRLAVVAGAMALPQVLSAEDEKPAQKDPAQVFAELDKNGDGTLKADEIAEGQRRFFEHLLRVAGKEKDGELTKEEFLKGFKPDDLKVAAPQNIGGFGGGNRPVPAQLFQRFDANKDRKLTLDEIPGPDRPRFQPLFDRLGKTELTFDEFVQALPRLAGGGAPGAGGFMADPEAYFKRLDTNSDGNVTLAEVPEPFRPQVERWLARLKKEKDDSLTLDDLKKIVAENRAREGRGEGQPGARQSPLFRKLDANADGKLSKEEFQKATELFDEFDLNKDGFLDPSELFGAPPGAPAAPSTGKDDRADAAPPQIKAGAIDRQAAVSPGNGPAGPAGKKGNGGRGAPIAGEIGKGIGQRLDTDGDGKIARNEARGRLKQNFDAIDKNGDGYLDRDEIRAALQQASGK